MENTAQENISTLFRVPDVDGDVMIWMLQNQTKSALREPEFAQSTQSVELIVREPDLDIPFSARFMLDAEPRIDEQAFSARLRVDTLDDEGIGPWPLGFSILWHAVLVGLIFGFVQFSSEVISPFEKSVSEPIEVSLGFTLESTQALPEGKTAEKLVDTAATKTEQQLPQLPKLLSVDAATPPPVDTSMALPGAAAVATPQPTSAPTATPTPKVVATPSPTPAPVVQQQPDPAATKKLKLEELAKRLEKEQRAVGAKEKAGTQKGAVNNDLFKRPKDIPISPLGKDIPKAPSVLGQTGTLTGKVGAQVKNEYAQAAALHMKKNWSLPDVLSFESQLEVVLGFDINTSGQIMGRIRVVRGSGNARFDEEAMRALEAAGPFPDLPREMGTKLSMRMKFSPQSINF
ncbi:MAG: TonB family protein [Betaproteobacteria bacterium]|nr:TonB family protein [Betaproteobacteria bacterium]